MGAADADVDPGARSALTFRRTTRADFPLLQRWLRSAHVSRYWIHETADTAIERDFGGSIDETEPSADYIVAAGDVPIGFVQRSEIWDYEAEQRGLIEIAEVPDRALTIDYFIGESNALGRGLGAQLIREFTELCFRECPQAPSIIVPVATGNVASWSALESAGYTYLATANLPPDNPVDDGEHRVYRQVRGSG